MNIPIKVFDCLVLIGRARQFDSFHSVLVSLYLSGTGHDIDLDLHSIPRFLLPLDMALLGVHRLVLLGLGL